MPREDSCWLSVFLTESRIVLHLDSPKLHIVLKVLPQGNHLGSLLCWQVKRFEVHKSKVNDISIDTAVEFIASCSDDGSAAVSDILAMQCKHNLPISDRTAKPTGITMLYD